MTQNDAILNHLKEGNSITPLEALNKYGCFRLGARIWDLRKEGHDIREKDVKANGKRFASYFLKPLQIQE